MSSEDYEALMETLDILSDPKAIGSLKRANADIEAGRVYTHTEVFDE